MVNFRYKFFRIFFMLPVIFIIGCSDKNEKIVNLNGKKINLSAENFEKIEIIIKENYFSKECDTLNLKLDNFFKFLDIEFNKENFNLKILNENEDKRLEYNIKVKNQTCFKTEMVK